MSALAPRSRKLIARSALALVYVLIMILMVITGRRHTILIDNAEAADGSYAAVEGMAVQVDRLESAEYYPGDRDMALVQGQKHRITVELFMEGRTEERSFSVPFGLDMAIISVPKLLAGIEPWLEPFTPTQAQEGGSDSGNQTMQFGGSAETDAAEGTAAGAVDELAPPAP